MNIYKSLFLGLVCSAGMHCTFAQTTVWNPDNQNGTFTTLSCGETGPIRI